MPRFWFFVVIFVFVRPRLGFAFNGKGEEAGLLVAAADLQEHTFLALLARIPDAGAHILDGRNRLAVELKDDVAALDALIGGLRIRIDARNRDAFLRLASGQVRRGHERQAKVFKLFAGFVFIVAAAQKRDLLGIRIFAELDVDVALFAIAEDVQTGIRAWGSAAIVLASSRELVTAFPLTCWMMSLHLEFGLGGGAIGQDLRDESALAVLQAKPFGDILVDILDLNAEPAAADLALVLELLHDIARRGRGNRERDADAAAARAIDRGVHADDLAVKIDRGAARIAAVHSGVDLQEVVRPGADVAALAPRRCRPSPCHRGRTDCRRPAPSRQRAAWNRRIQGN